MDSATQVPPPTVSDSVPQQVQQQAKLLDGILNSVPCGILLAQPVRDATGRVTDFRVTVTNQRMAELSGFSQEQILRHSMLTLDPEGSTSGIFDQYVAALQVAKPTDLEHYIAATDRWLLQTLTPFDGGVLVSMIDMTDQKRAQFVQQKQAELLRSVLDGSQNGIIAFDAVRNETGAVVDFRYALQNETNGRRVGRTDEELLGHTMLEFFPDTAHNGMLTQYIQVVESGNPLRLEHKFSYKNQSGWFDYSVVKRGDGMVMTVQDKTTEKNAELVVKRQAEFLQTVIDTSPAGIIAYKAIRANGPNQPITDFVVDVANIGGAQAIGRQLPTEFVGRLMSDLLPSEEGRAFFALVADVAETGIAKVWLHPYFSDGIEGWFNTSLVKQDDLVVVTFLDVSDLKILQQQLEEQNVALRRSNDNLQQFAYVASHDLQEPLRKINTFSQLLLNDHAVNLNETGQDMLRRTQVAANRMSMLINDLLAYSRLSTEQAPFKLVPLPAIIDRILEDLDLAISEAGAIMTVGELPTVSGDVVQLTQLFQNLLSNAIKFRHTTSPKATYQPRVQISSRQVSIHDLPESLRLQHLPTNRRHAEKIPAFHEISVADNGIGFDERYLDRIFQVFQRLHGKNQFPGSGVGLAICRKVVDNHKGAITASSQPGEGTTFRVYLPIR